MPGYYNTFNLFVLSAWILLLSCQICHSLLPFCFAIYCSLPDVVLPVLDSSSMMQCLPFVHVTFKFISFSQTFLLQI